MEAPVTELGQAEKRRAAIDAFSKQVGWCESLGSPFTARLLTVLAEDIAADGIAAALVGARRGDPLVDALALRMAGALHALALMESDDALVACYPPNPAAATDALRSVVRRVAVERRDFIEKFLASPPQTNEVGRSGVLFGGFLEIAAATGLPLRLLEIGASAGLNAIWDRYHYQLGDADWGDRRSAVRLAPEWRGPSPPLEASLRISERRASDAAPIDLEDPAQRLRLRAYVWADQRERLSRLEAAITTARAVGQKGERAAAGDWLGAQLKHPAKATTTVIFHSVVWQYLPAETRTEIKAMLQEAGGEATETSPLAWLRFEPSHAESQFELRLALWPNARESRLEVAHPHGNSVMWSGWRRSRRNLQSG
jgi:hypothetical protein